MAGEVIPPPYVITADDKRGLIVVTGAAVLAFVWSCFLIRVWLRLQSREWRSDDWWLAAATLLDTVQSGIVFHLVNLGLGASQAGIPLSQLQQLGNEGFASQIIYILMLLASKLSVLFLYLRLAPGGSYRTVSWSLVALSCAWALVSVILIATPCNPAQTYTNADNCTNRWPKWLSIGTFDIFTEIFIFLAAVHLIYSLQMRLRAKLLVIFAFSARLPVIAIAVVRLYYLDQRLREITFTFDYIVATQWQMGYAIMPSTITGMGPFLKPFDKEYVSSTHKHYGPGHSSSGGMSGVRMESGLSTTASSGLPPRRQGPGHHRRSVDNISESYLMDTLPSRRTSKQSMGNEDRPNSLEPIQSGSPSSRGSPPAPTNILMTADEHFRPTHMYRGHETEVWTGNGSMSISRDEMEKAAASRGCAPKPRTRLVIGKKEEFKIEVDRASRV
ncbi:hypothetical protein G6011_06525 [Alternaria panax]|uniref:Rhodopsin domain-containing protein n=1 Tax=Alternaria panax TaxID=48097 RepID=A0AAD4I861_9PLEO|nr:hypothetical protein G6011_06525 [Alternaria panax]